MFRRLATKTGCYAVSRAVSYELCPSQLGVSLKGCAEAVVHAVRKVITNKIDSDDPKIIVRLDTMNVFNSVRRYHVLQICLDRTPEIAKLFNSRLQQSDVSHCFRSFDNLVVRRLTRRSDRPSPVNTRSRSDRQCNRVRTERLVSR